MRLSAQQGPMHHDPVGGTLRFSVFEVDMRSGELRKRGVRVPLQQQPFRILIRLVDRPGEVVTRAELHQELWPTDTYVDFEQGINGAVKRLREALGDSAETPRFIETLPKRGYRFIAPIDAATPQRRRSRVSLTRLGKERAADAERALSKARFLMDARLEHWLQESFTLLHQAVTAAPADASAHVAVSQWYVYAVCTRQRSVRHGISGSDEACPGGRSTGASIGRGSGSVGPNVLCATLLPRCRADLPTSSRTRWRSIDRAWIV